MNEQIDIEGESSMSELVRTIGLKPHDGEMFIGKSHGFPIGLKFITAEHSILLLMQIRHPFDANTAGQLCFTYEAHIKDLIESKKIEISVEDKIAWVTIPEAGTFIDAKMVPPVVDSILATFERAGLAGASDKCHHCQNKTVESLACSNGKVVQICDECLASKIKSQTKDLQLSAEGFTKVIALGIVASLVGALGWMLSWIGYDAIFKLFNTPVLLIPRILELVALILVAFLVGGPVGFIINRIRGRGNLVAGSAGIVFGILTVILGEIFYVTWLIYGEFKVFSPYAAISILPKLLFQSGGFYLLTKAGTAFVSVTVAYQMSRPKPLPLKL